MNFFKVTWLRNLKAILIAWVFCLSFNLKVKAQAGDGLVNIHFPELTDVKDIIKAVSLWTGKQIILDNNVNEKVQIISLKKVTQEEAYLIFLSALDTVGLTTVETGKLIKIIKKRDALKDNLKVLRGKTFIPATDEMITQVFPLQYIPADQTRVTLSRIMPASSIISYDITNTLIISDTGNNLRRVSRILDIIDIRGNQPELIVIPIMHAQVKQIDQMLKQMTGLSTQSYNSQSGVLKQFKTVSDEKSNILFAFGPKSLGAAFLAIIKQLDAPGPRNGGSNYFVRPLEFTSAKYLATVLNSLRASEKNKPGITKDLKIIADEPTNSLIITGGSQAYQAVNQLVRRLDRQKAQVFFLVDILEVQSSDTFRYASSILAGLGSEGKGTKYITGWQAASSAPLILAGNAASEGQAGREQYKAATAVFADDFSIALLPSQEVHLAGIGKISPTALLKLIKSDSMTKVLSSPYILTSDHEEAFVSVGETIFFNSVQNDPSGIPIPKVEKENVDLTLKLLPSISQSNHLSLKVEVEASDIAGFSEGGMPRVTKRKAVQNIIIKNDQTMVMSGLTKRYNFEQTNKVPLLGDLPIVGWLFRNSQIQTQSSHLLFFVTPYVVRNSEDLTNLYKSRIASEMTLHDHIAKGIDRNLNKD